LLQIACHLTLGGAVGITTYDLKRDVVNGGTDQKEFIDVESARPIPFGGIWGEEYAGCDPGTTVTRI